MANYNTNINKIYTRLYPYCGKETEGKYNKSQSKDRIL